MSSTTQVISSTENLHHASNTLTTNLTKEPNSGTIIHGHGPEWLTKNYMENCLRSYYNDSKLNIHKIDIRPALGKGENYGGVLTRIKAEFKMGSGCNKTGHYIVKTSYEGNEFACNMMEPYDIFNREMSIYKSVLPKLNSLLRELNDDEQIFAETMMIDSERSALIFEDLNVRDFVMPNRIQGLDMDLTKIILRKLAKMHAASAVLNERENGTLECYNRGMFNRYTENYAPAFVGLLEACIRLVNRWTDFKYYGEKLNKLKPQYMELGKRVFDPIKGHLNVLVHGDLWTNNVMVKYDHISGKPLDVIIIDFQYSAWGSPAIDLHYLFNTSLKEDMHLNAHDELVQYYHSILTDTLRKLLFKQRIPSLHSFHLQVDEKAFYAFNSTCVVLPVQRNEETEDADFTTLMQTNERSINFKNTCYKNNYCQRMIRQLLPVYERKGLLDLYQ